MRNRKCCRHEFLQKCGNRLVASDKNTETQKVSQKNGCG